MKRIVSLLKYSLLEVLTVVAMLCLVVSIVVDKYNENILISEAIEEESLNNDTITLTLVEESEDTYYGSIKTHRFTIVNANNMEPTNLNRGEIKLEDIVLKLDNYLKDLRYRVVAIGIIDNTIYIQYDTTQYVSNIMRVNIITVKEGMETKDWIQFIETLHNDVKVCASSIVSYKTDVGNRHYIYVYEAD